MKHHETQYFVGWVEASSDFVGFRCTLPNLHSAGDIAKCETQQQPIWEPSPKSFFSDQTGRLFGQRRRLYETRLKSDRRIENIEPQNVEGWFRAAQPLLKLIEYIPSSFGIRYFYLSFFSDQTGRFSGKRLS